jgi:hypothetical protein
LPGSSVLHLISLFSSYLASSQFHIPSEPSLNRGCSAGSAIPRQSSGAAGRWKLSVGRAEERRAREAARGRNEAIVEFVEYSRTLKASCQALNGVVQRRQWRLVNRDFLGWRHLSDQRVQSVRSRQPFLSLSVIELHLHTYECLDVALR